MMNTVLLQRGAARGSLFLGGRQRSHQTLTPHVHPLTSAASASDLVISTMDEKSGIAMLTMNRPPANTLSLEMNEALSYSIKTIEANPKIQSVILSSTNPKIFCAGLDIAELIVNPDDMSNRLTKFWNSLQQVYIDLYGSRLATVAAMNGHAPAAGCLLALMCDYRIISSGDGSGKNVPTIGLNETKLGIACSPWMAQMMVSTIGTRKTELALALGTLFPPHEALAVGLVDNVISNQEAESNSTTTITDREGLINLLPTPMKEHATNPVLQNAYTQAQVYAKIPPHARVASKMVIRDEPLFKMIAKRDEDLNNFCGFVTQKSVQKNLALYVEAMKNKVTKK